MTRVVWKGFDWVDMNHRSHREHADSCLFLLDAGDGCHLLQQEPLHTLDGVGHDHHHPHGGDVHIRCGPAVHLWRRVHSFFIHLGRWEMGKIVIKQAGYKQVPLRKDGEDPGGDRVSRPQRQLKVVAESDRSLRFNAK